MMVKLYVYKKSTGAFLYEDAGNPKMVLFDVGSDKDFTLTPPPSDGKRYLWKDEGWQAIEEPKQPNTADNQTQAEQTAE